MTSNQSAWLRSLQIFGLYTVLAVTIPFAWMFKTASGGSLTVAEWAKRRLVELRGA